MDPKSPKWIGRFLHIARSWAAFSKDPSTKVGAVVVAPNGRQLSAGFNGLPPGVVDHPERYERPTKYKYVVHAERNAIDAAAGAGVALAGSMMVVTHFPCTDCVKSIIGAGIECVAIGPDMAVMTDPEDRRVALEMLTEAGLGLIFHADEVE